MNIKRIGIFSIPRKLIELYYHQYNMQIMKIGEKMKRYSESTYKKYVKELEKLGSNGIMANDFLGKAQDELIDAQEKVNFIEYYLRHACNKCDKLMIHHGNGLYQCPNCKYTELVTGVNVE